MPGHGPMIGFQSGEMSYGPAKPAHELEAAEPRVALAQTARRTTSS